MELRNAQTDKYNQFDYVALNKGCVRAFVELRCRTIIIHNIQRALLP